MKLVAAGVVAAFATFVHAGTAKAPTVFVLHSSDAAALSDANVKCVAKDATALVCGGGRSRIFVRLTRDRVYVFRAVGRSRIFKTLFETHR